LIAAAGVWRAMTITETAPSSTLGPRIRLPRAFRVNSGKASAEGTVRATIVSRELTEEFARVAGAAAEAFPVAMRIFALDLRPSDDVVVRTVENGLPLVVRRGGEIIVNFDVQATQAFEFADSKRPIYTHIPGFNIQRIPAAMRRPLSNLVQSLSSRQRKNGGPEQYRRLPLTDFEFATLLLGCVLADGRAGGERLFQWPGGKNAAFVSLHDIDTPGFLRRRERDPLYQVERKHGVRATWFVPTAVLKDRKEAVDFLLESGNEVGWHGYNHDHRLPYRPFAEQRVAILKNSYFARPASFPIGMRTPRLLKSNHLFDVLDRSCPLLRYDTSFLRGIVPYHLWVNGRRSRILEIPTTVPTDIAVYNNLHEVPRSRRPEAILEVQIARTKHLLEIGGLISIVTHPEKDLTERPELLDVYDRYLAFVRSCPNVWFATAGEVFTHWTGERTS
jgi:peptidoglycan/xylan/chitin deacetylase (PgdA/CDA1 family)